MAKILMLWRPDEGSAESFEESWLSLLARTTQEGGLAGLVRIVNNRATPVELRPISDSGNIGWLGVTEFWFDDWADAKATIEQLRQESLLANVRTEFLPVDDRLMVDTNERPLLLKAMVLWKRKQGLSRQEAQDYWAVPHVRFGMQELGLDRFLRRYFQNHVIALPWLNPTQHDGVSEMWVKDPEAFAEMGSNGDVLRKVAEDEENFMDSSEMLILQEAEIYRRDRSAPRWTAGDA